MEKLFKELKAEDICETNVVPIQPKKDTAVILPTVSVSIPKRSASPIFSQNILEWTQTQVQDWLLEHNLVQMSRLLMNYDGRSLIYLHRYIKYGRPEQVLNMLQEDSIRRTNQCLSLVELSYFHSLLDKQKRLLQLTIFSQQTRKNTNNDKNDS
ncbi:unnamed protein product [Rotaria sordida]|uniref:SAM domain-containing protein n=1 Tax=Rotaria sordida TaxID=392033 RepID=A0A814LE76_9BILA|nr:unnamed protein product [Rotaria sordida]